MSALDLALAIAAGVCLGQLAAGLLAWPLRRLVGAIEFRLRCGAWEWASWVRRPGRPSPGGQ